jgi:hypothetical protein
MEVILPLLDQVYALRRDLRALTRAVDALPEDARAAVLRQVWGRTAKAEFRDSFHPDSPGIECAG